MDKLLALCCGIIASVFLTIPSISNGNVPLEQSVLSRSTAKDQPEVRVIDGSIEFTATLKKATLNPGESLSLEVALKNLSDHKVILQNNWSEGAHLVFGLYDANGREVEYPGYNLRGKTPSPQFPKDFVILDSRRTFVRHFKSGPVVPYAPKRTGEYRLRLMLSTEGPDTPSGKAISVTARPDYILFYVKAKHAKRAR